MKTKLITTDMSRMVKHAVSGRGFNLEKYDTSGSLVFYIGKAKIMRGVGEDRPILDLEDGFNKDYGKLWYNDVGKVLTKELHKKEPLLYELSTKQFKALLKRIDDEQDDVEWIVERGLCHVRIGDYDYVIIRIVHLDEGYSRKDKHNDYYIDKEIQEALNKERGEDEEFDESTHNFSVDIPNRYENVELF